MPLIRYRAAETPWTSMLTLLSVAWKTRPFRPFLHQNDTKKNNSNNDKNVDIDDEEGTIFVITYLQSFRRLPPLIHPLTQSTPPTDISATYLQFTFTSCLIYTAVENEMPRRVMMAWAFALALPPIAATTTTTAPNHNVNHGISASTNSHNSATNSGSVGQEGAPTSLSVEHLHIIMDYFATLVQQTTDVVPPPASASSLPPLSLSSTLSSSSSSSSQQQLPSQGSGTTRTGPSQDPSSSLSPMVAVEKEGYFGVDDIRFQVIPSLKELLLIAERAQRISVPVISGRIGDCKKRMVVSDTPESCLLYLPYLLVYAILH